MTCSDSTLKGLTPSRQYGYMDLIQIFTDLLILAGGTAVLSVIEPATEQVLAEVPEGDIEAAVARATAAFPAWRAVTPEDRSRLLLSIAGTLEAHAEELARLEARNAGKPIGSARSEIGVVIHAFRYYA